MYISKEAELLVKLIVNHNFAMTNIARTQFQSHPFHMVEPSPWPLLTAFALLTLTVSGVLYFNGIQNSEVLVTLGFLSTLFAMILWFRDVTIEGTYLGDHTFAVQKGITMGVALFILSEACFFFSIFWA
jgi:cytochrome c oxidase subunit 3